MKKLLVILLFASLIYGAGGSAPAAYTEDAMGIEIIRLDSSISTNCKFARRGNSGLDTLAGADSVLIWDDFRPQGHEGWQYILQTSALSGDSAANTVLTVLVKAFDQDDSLISHTVVDTFAAAGSAIRIPFGESHGYFGSKFDLYLKSGNSNDETVIERLKFWGRRPIRMNKTRP